MGQWRCHDHCSVPHNVITVVTLTQPLTSLIGGDVDGDMLCRIRALIADCIDSLYLKAVQSVSQQVADEHPGLSQTQLFRNEVHVVVTMRAGASVSSALLADDVVADVVTAARFSRSVPLQDHRGFVHDRNHISGAGWHAWKWDRGKVGCQEQFIFFSSAKFDICFIFKIAVHPKSVQAECFTKQKKIK